MFIGEFEHNIDDKGRLIMPAKFREELGNEFVVTKGLDGCLFVYTLKEWSNIEEKMHEKPMTTREARKFMRFFFAGAANCEVDKQGRILLPQNDSNAYSEDEMDEIAENMAEIGIFI